MISRFSTLSFNRFFEEWEGWREMKTVLKRRAHLHQFRSQILSVLIFKILFSFLPGALEPCFPSLVKSRVVKRQDLSVAEGLREIVPGSQFLSACHIWEWLSENYEKFGATGEGDSYVILGRLCRKTRSPVLRGKAVCDGSGKNVGVNDIQGV